MAIELQDGILVKAPYPADRKKLVGTIQEYASKELIPIQYRYAYMEVTVIDSGLKYRLESNLSTWTLIPLVPSWVKTSQSDVTLSIFGGNLDWTRIVNAPEFTELDPVVFDVITLNPGSDATVDGIHPNFTLGIPRGDVGPPGEDGNDGILGTDGITPTVNIGTTTTGAAGTNADVTNSGTAIDSIWNFAIPRGDDGTSATVDVGTTTTGNAGSNADVTNSGTTADAVFDFVIPKGDTGDTGDTGPAGSGVTILGSDTGANIILKSGSAGDMWISTDTGTNDDGGTEIQEGDGVVYDGADWLTVGPIRGPQGIKGDQGDGWTGVTYSSSTGFITFASADGLDYITEDVRGDTGAQGDGWTGVTYNSGTGFLTFASDIPALELITSDIRGQGWSSGTYVPATGIVEFRSTLFPSLDFDTSDLRGADGSGTGLPAGGDVDDLIFNIASGDGEWQPHTFADRYGDLANYFQVAHLRLSDLSKSASSGSGYLAYDAYDGDIGIHLNSEEPAHVDGPIGLFLKNTQTIPATFWNTQHFGPINVNKWEDHADSTHAPTDANNYVHPNHGGNITGTGDGDYFLHSSSITGKTYLTKVDAADQILISDTSTSGALRRTPMSGVLSYIQDNIVTGNNYVHPEHTGQVISSIVAPNAGDGALFLTVSAITAQAEITDTISAAQDSMLYNSRGNLRELPMTTLESYFIDKDKLVAELQSDFGYYLPLTGGIMTGDIYMNSGTSIQFKNAESPPPFDGVMSLKNDGDVGIIFEYAGITDVRVHNGGLTARSIIESPILASTDIIYGDRGEFTGKVLGRSDQNTNLPDSNEFITEGYATANYQGSTGTYVPLAGGSGVGEKMTGTLYGEMAVFENKISVKNTNYSAAYSLITNTDGADTLLNLYRYSGTASTHHNFRLRNYDSNEFKIQKSQTAANIGSITYEDVFYIKSNKEAEFFGNVYGTAWFDSSDRKLKENIKTIDLTETDYRFVEFNWKDSGKKSYGVIADEVEKITPELVGTRKDGTQSVNYSAILIREIAALKNRIEKLEKNNS